MTSPSHYPFRMVRQTATVVKIAVHQFKTHIFHINISTLGFVLYTMNIMVELAVFFPWWYLIVKLKIDGILDSVKYDHLFHSTNSCSNGETDRSASELQFSVVEVAEELDFSSGEGVLVGEGFRKGFLEKERLCTKGCVEFTSSAEGEVPSRQRDAFSQGGTPRG